MFLVNGQERNRFDQKWIETKIVRKHSSIPVVYKTMKDMVERAQLNEDKLLMM